MGLRDAIGIDPDAKGFVCAYVKLSGAKATTKDYMSTDLDLKAFLYWVKGQCSPSEHFGPRYDFSKRQYKLLIA